MAKCKKCGKEIPNGGVCSCTGVNENKSESSKLPWFKRIFKGDGFIEWIAVIVLILVLGFITMLSIGFPNHAAKKFARSLTKEKSGKTYFSMIYPDEFIKNIKDSFYIERHPSVTSWDNELSNYKKLKKEEFSNGKLKVKKVEKTSRLSTEAVNAASNYFKTKFSVQNYHCTRGYEYSITFDKEGADESPIYRVCLVKLKNDGWKVIEMTAEQLMLDY